MKTEQLAYFQHQLGTNGTKLVKATEFTKKDGSKEWRVCIIIDEDATWYRPESRALAIQIAEAAIAPFVKYLNELYNGE